MPRCERREPWISKTHHVGIVVVGLGLDGHAYVLEDASVRAPPATWGRVVVDCFDRHAADCVVAEVNFGGAMVEAIVQAAAASAKVRVRYREVRASRGKIVRAEPISTLYEEGKVHHVGVFPVLEDELVAFSTHGNLGDGSPDRADALVWGLSELFPRVVAGEKRDEKIEVYGNPIMGRRDNRPRLSGASWQFKQRD
jgi:predicted phage terminase large subunit-like protein